MPGLFFLIFAALVVVFIFAAIHSHKREKERTAKLAAWAHASGMSFRPGQNSSFRDQFPLASFQQGDGGRYAYNISHGERGGMQMIAGDYHYYTESTDSDGDTSTTHHHFSFALMRPDFRLRNLTIRKEGIFDKLGAAFGFDDIDFESAEFSKRFHVKSDDRRWAYDVIHPRTMEFLMQEPGMRLECIPGALVVYTGKRWTVPQFEHYASRATTFLDGIPEHAREGKPG